MIENDAGLVILKVGVGLQVEGKTAVALCTDNRNGRSGSISFLGPKLLLADCVAGIDLDHNTFRILGLIGVIAGNGRLDQLDVRDGIGAFLAGKIVDLESDALIAAEVGGIGSRTRPADAAQGQKHFLPFVIKTGILIHKSLIPPAEPNIALHRFQQAEQRIVMLGQIGNFNFKGNIHVFETFGGERLQLVKVHPDVTGTGQGAGPIGRSVRCAFPQIGILGSDILKIGVNPYSGRGVKRMDNLHLFIGGLPGVGGRLDAALSGERAARLRGRRHKCGHREYGGCQCGGRQEPFHLLHSFLLPPLVFLVYEYITTFLICQQ